MPKRKESLATLALLENDNSATLVEHDNSATLVEEEPEEEIDDNIQASKEIPKEIPKKPRAPKSQKQLDAFTITRQKGIEASQARKIATQEKLKIQKEEKEERIVKTAIVIKKKQIKRERILENVSDGEDDERPQKSHKQSSVKEQPPAHRFIFV